MTIIGQNLCPTVIDYINGTLQVRSIVFGLKNTGAEADNFNITFMHTYILQKKEDIWVL